MGTTWDPGEAGDLRRRRRADTARRLVELADPLPEHERALVRHVFDQGRPVTELAALLGEPVRRVRLRIRKLVDRLTDPRFSFVLARSRDWPSSRRSIAEACFVRGESMREASDRLGMSLHTVRRHRDAVEAMFEAAAELAAMGPRGAS
ncbi:MAG: hypothetical protein AAGG07_07515 [Planctomycetota bacterium]